MSATVTDEQIRQLAAMAKPYSLALLVGSERDHTATVYSGGTRPNPCCLPSADGAAAPQVLPRSR